MATMSQLLTVLFGAFGMANDVNRQQIYAMALKDVPMPILEKAIYKTIDEWENPYVPPIAIVLKSAKSFAESLTPDTRVKTWGEAWGEIEKAMYRTPWGETPKWSTPEIAKAVNAFGWHDLQTTLESDMPTVRAQLRRMYDEACQRTSDDARNAYLRGENHKGVLGIGEREKSGLKPISESLKTMM